MVGLCLDQDPFRRANNKGTIEAFILRVIWVELLKLLKCFDFLGFIWIFILARLIDV